jgi:ligand-binding sensor domain-containing protein/signal transduction histidine kinase
MNKSGSLLTRSRSKHLIRGCAAAACFLQLASALSAAEPGLVRLAVSEGKDIRFAHLTGKDGLSPGGIRNVLQDDQGFIWFNTSAALNRYDGYQVKSYRRDRSHPNYPVASFLQHVIKDRAGYLWASSNESLERFDPRNETSTRWPIDRNGPKSVHGPVLHALEDRAGIIWLATSDGLHRLDPATGAFRHYSHNPADPATLSSSIVKSTYEDREGTLWVCTLAGLEAFDRGTGRVTERIHLNMAATRGIRALEDHSGVLWIAYTSGNGLASWDRHSRRLTLYSFKEHEPPASQLSGVSGIHEDADGYLWLATYGSGLVKIDPARRSAIRYRNSLLDPDSILDDMLNSVFEDSEGNIWVGSGTGGVSRFQRKPLPFQRYRHDSDNPQSLLRTAVSSVYVDSQDNIWVGSGAGLTRIDGKTGAYSFFQNAGGSRKNLSNTLVVSIVEDRFGYMWFGTYGGGLNRYDPRTGAFAAFRHDLADSHSLSSDIVYALMVDRQGTLWAGTDDGLNRLEDADTGRFRSWKAGSARSTSQEVGAIVQDPNGVLWLVSGTLQRFDPAAERFTSYTFDFSGTGKVDRQSSTTLVASATTTVNSFLAIDHSGVLWVATPNGLLRFNRESEEFTTYDQRDGLPALSVLGIVEDRKGNLWLGTDGGLSQFDPRTKTFTNYYEADGLAGNAFEGFPAACQSQRGQMFFGSKSGLTSFWPEQIVEQPSVPPVVLTGFSLRNQPVAPGAGSVLANSITFTPSLTLSNDQNLFSFEFAALSFVDPERNQYRYMLEGLDHSWNRVDPKHRLATFTSLPTGDYTLRVQGSNNRGVWNEQGVALHLQILPPWWATWWFRAVCAAVSLAMLWAAYQFRVRQLQQEFNMRLEGRLDERARIARDLHDTLLQSFQGLIPVFQTARNLLPGQSDRAAQVLDEGLHDAAHAIVEGRNAIQNLRARPSLDPDLGSLLNAVGKELAQPPEAEGSAPTFRVVVEGSRLPLAPLLQDEIYRIGREVLLNAFRHAHASRIEAEIRYDRDIFRLRIRDDGKGIESSVLKEGVRTGHWGLPGMHERAEKMGGRLKIWSEPGAGTEAELTVPARIAYEKVCASNGWWARLVQRLRPSVPNREA